MSTETPTTARHELEETIAALMAGKRDPEAAKRSRQEMDRMREEIRNRMGTVEIVVEYLRDHRDR